MKQKLSFANFLAIAVCLLLALLPAGADGKKITDTIAQKKLVVGVMAGPPWSMKDADGNWTGISVDLWREIAELLKLRYEFREYDLEGVLDAIEHGKVDVAATGLAITAEREARFDFSDPYFVFNQTVAVNANQQTNIYSVLKSEIFNWGLIGLILTMIAITLLGAGILWLLERKGDSEHYSKQSKKAFTKSIFWSMTVLLGRDFPGSVGWKTHPPATTAGRVFAIGWVIIGVTLFSLFTAGAASLLTTRQLQSIVNSPDDLRHVKVGTVIGSAAQAYMDRHNMKYTTYDTPVQVLEALVAHKVDAVVYGSTTLSYYAKNQFNNKISVLRFSLRQDFAALPVPTDSPLRKLMNDAILKVLESKHWQSVVEKYVSSDSM